MPFAMEIDSGRDDDGGNEVDIDMGDTTFLLSLKPASKEDEVEEKIQKIAEGKHLLHLYNNNHNNNKDNNKDNNNNNKDKGALALALDISVPDALDYIASITKMGKVYYQARTAFVWQYLQQQVHAGVLNHGDILTPLLDRMDAPSPDFLLVAFTILHDLLPTFDVESSVRVVSKIMSVSRAFPDAMVPREWESMQATLRLLNTIINSPTINLPVYTIYTELPSNPHWTMQAWLIPYQKRLSRLCYLFAPSGMREMCTIPGLFRLEEAAMAANMKNVARYTPAPDWGRAWHTCVHSLHHLICQGAPVDWIQAHLSVLGQIMETHEYTAPPLPISNATPPPAPPKSAASQLLLDAAVMRVMQLLDLHEEVNGRSMEQLMLEWWGEWCCFSDQFYVWVEIGLLDYEKFVLALSEKYTKSGGPLRNNAIIWLLGQCLPLEHVKEMFRSELVVQHGTHYGRVFPFVLSLYNESQLQEGRAIQVRDTAVLCFAIRIYGIIGPSPALTPSGQPVPPPPAASNSPPYPDVKKYITRMTEQLGTKVQEYRVQDYKAWWTKFESSKEKIDYFNATESVLAKVCVLSTSMSQPISNSIMEFMCSAPPPEELVGSEPGQPAIPHFPGFLSFNGRAKPFSISFLGQLAIRCRQRVLDMILASLTLEPKTELGMITIPSNTPIPPGMMETFVRLLYITPSASRNRYRIHSALQSNLPNDLRGNAMLDMINYRLIRYFKHFNAIKHLFLDVHEWIFRFPNNHQLSDSVTALMIKLCTQLNEVVRFAKNVNTVNFGEPINRLLILSLARVIKTKGAYDFSRIKDVPQLLARLHEVSPHIWSSATQRYFPPLIKAFYNPSSVPSAPSSANTSSSNLFAPSPSQFYSSPTIPSALTTSGSSTNFYASPSQPTPPTLPPQGPPPSIATYQRVAEELERNGQSFLAIDQHTHSFVNFYQSWPQNKPLFLCQVWLYILRNGGQSPIERFVQAIFYTFSAQEVVNCTYTFVSFLLDESPLQTRPMSRLDVNQRRHVVREPAAPDKLREACNLLVNFVHAWHILPLEVTLLALMDRDDDPNAFPLLDFLLVDSPLISHRLDAFYSLNLNPNIWKEDTYFQKNVGYNTTFSDAYLNKPALPIYYGNICLRLLPILDVLLRRLIENDQGARLEKYIARYQALYNYHDSPIANVSDILLYYYDCPLFNETPDVKLKLLGLLEGAHGNLSEMFKLYFNSKKIEHIISPLYFESVVHRIESVINVHNMTPPFYNNTQIHFFQEFPSATEGGLLTTAMEVMCLPLSPKDISVGIFNYMTTGPVNLLTEGIPFQRVAAVALLFTRLPAVFHAFLFEHALTGLKECHLYDSVYKLGQTARTLFVDFSANSETLMTNPVNTALTILHVFFSHASIETVAAFPALVRSLRPLRNMHQFFLIVKVIAPFLIRISTNPQQDLLHEILAELLKGLKDVENLLVDESSRDAKYDDYTFPSTLLDIVIDFFYHCKAVCNLKPPLLAAMHEIIFTLRPHVQMHFKHF